MTDAASAPRPAALACAGVALGFGLGGFFDGILLHQVLQWHHLLSGVEQARGDIRLLILTDGLFHLLMYVITGVGLWLLWLGRWQFPAPAADRRLLADALIGFGGWHILDGILSHWVLGIHRIRMDADNPLLWDLLWFAVFGLVPLAVGILHRRGKDDAGARLVSSPLALVLAVAMAGPISALPAPRQDAVMVLFRPEIAPSQAFAAMQAVGGSLVWTDESQQLWAMRLSPERNAAELYRYGALLVSNSTIPAGCLDWTRA